MLLLRYISGGQKHCFELEILFQKYIIMTKIVPNDKVDCWGKGLFRTFEDFEFRAGFFRLLWREIQNPQMFETDPALSLFPQQSSLV
jgi:hypothetical protein